MRPIPQMSFIQSVIFKHHEIQCPQIARQLRFLHGFVSDASEHHAALFELCSIVRGCKSNSAKSSRKGGVVEFKFENVAKERRVLIQCYSPADGTAGARKCEKPRRWTKQDRFIEDSAQRNARDKFWCEAFE